MYIHKIIFKLSSTYKLPITTHTPQPFVGNPEEIITKRLKHYPNIYQTHYTTPLVITEGYMQYLYDHRGNRYLDL
jgi:alanine-glyoxylate transaminase/(R)-3-amino-2-methylpropionate-pyruvate transaminase